MTTRRAGAAARAAALALAVVAAAPARAQDAPPAPLRVRDARGAWQAWWRADRAPTRWTAADARVASAVQWRATAPGLEVAELELAAPGEGGIGALGRVRLVLARIDPRRHALQLVAGSPPGSPWRIDDAPRDARLALNAGQFTDEGPWGWLVHAGRELQAPAVGPLSSALLVARDGTVRLADAAELPVARAAAARGEIVEAVQSYPALLAGDGDVPAPLRAPDRGVDIAHRDARLAVGTLRDGRVLVVLTRFDALGTGALSRVPLGLTVPEMAAVTGALGCARAVLLDGGLSAQLLVRDARGSAQRWPGLRHVPLGLVAVPRASEVATRRDPQ
ncbi:MAG: phosphodiester glycosidase family protein [Gemmatirosa sp.]